MRWRGSALKDLGVQRFAPLRRRAMKERSGMTLIEILAAVILSAVLATTAGGWFLAVQKSSQRQNGAAAHLQAWALVATLLNQDALCAGDPGHAPDISEDGRVMTWRTSAQWGKDGEVGFVPVQWQADAVTGGLSRQRGGQPARVCVDLGGSWQFLQTEGRVRVQWRATDGALWTWHPPRAGVADARWNTLP